jgi:hypothetical protein
MTNLTVKACVNCAHCAKEMDFLVCTHPELLVKETNYVYGIESTTALLCHNLREDGSRWKCGPEGRYWVEKQTPSVPAQEVALWANFWADVRGMIRGLLGGRRP